MNPSETESPWQKLLARLHHAAQGLSDTLLQQDEKAKKQLDARAKLIAFAVEHVRSEEQGQEVLTFHLADQRCAISTRFVFELFPFPPITPLPGVPVHIVGVANVRGQILLMVDLARLFGFPAPQIDREKQLLVVGTERPEFGVICRGEGQAMRLPKSSLSRSKELHVAPLSGCVEAVTSDGMLLLDGKELLRDPRLFLHQVG
ncbi:MAG TPA: chemotaxis protein CheW [Pseudomonadota bacterium]|jgi:purine-binding chemotaxis protein CheW|nr:chemotaxis protein CheW [Pseudomonadota bacterium]